MCQVRKVDYIAQLLLVPFPSGTVKINYSVYRFIATLHLAKEVATSKEGSKTWLQSLFGKQNGVDCYRHK